MERKKVNFSSIAGLGSGAMAGISLEMFSRGLAYPAMWPPLVTPPELYSGKMDDIPEKWRKLAKYARKSRVQKKWKNKIKRRIRKLQKGERRNMKRLTEKNKQGNWALTGNHFRIHTRRTNK